MAVSPAPDVAGATSNNPSNGSRSATFRVALLGLLVIVLLASSGTMIWLVAGRTGKAEDLQGQREAVMAQSRLFMLRVNTYGPDLLDDNGEMPSYRKLVTEILTPKFTTSFEQGVTAAEQTVAQANVGRTAEVFAVGVAAIDADSATALVAGSFTSYQDRKGKKRISAEPAPFRVEVKLVRSGGTWLIDDFSPVTGAQP